MWRPVFVNCFGAFLGFESPFIEKAYNPLQMDEDYKDSFERMEEAMGKLGHNDEQREAKLRRFGAIAVSMQLMLQSSAAGKGPFYYSQNHSPEGLRQIRDFIDNQLPENPPADVAGKAVYDAMRHLQRQIDGRLTGHG